MEAFSLGWWVVVVAVHVIGTMLSIAAFARHARVTDSYYNSDERAFAIGLSILFWPICIFLICSILLFRKVYNGR